MEGKIIDGKAVAQRIKERIKAGVDELSREKGITPGLTVILVGEDPASQIYVRNKEKACQEVGIRSRVMRMAAETSQEELLRVIEDLNQDKAVHGILVQLPLPKHIDEKQIINAIHPGKDVDGFHPVNVGKMMIGEPCLEPCTPKGILRLLDETGIDLAGKRAVVIGRSNIVGKPVSLMLLKRDATVTVCHSKTQNLKEITREADILVVAMGRPESIDGSYIKEGAVVIDVGTTRVDQRLKGDVVFEEAIKKASWITPVPGGVGPMTIAMLLENTLTAARNHG